MEWEDLFQKETKKEYFVKLKEFLDEEYKNKIIYPLVNNLFNAFSLTKFNDVKVVILGQDPYHEPNQAMGLAFSVPSTTKIPPSLKNIYKEITNEFGWSEGTSGDLTYLAKQGVFLLNTILTVEKGKALSHKNKGWEIFTDEVIKSLNDSNHPICFILLGDPAIKKSALIANKNHLILTAPHPSPLSAYRGFFGSNVFRNCNKFLEANNLTPIKW